MSTIKVIDSTGQAGAALDLGIKMPNDDLNPQTYACAVRVLLQNWRQGTVGCKGRSDVAFSNKKPWKQKGTGRARAGSARSPLWRKGGVTFGPQARVRRLKINRKQKRLALRNLFQMMSAKDAIYCIDKDFNSLEKPSTKQAHNLFKASGVNTKKNVLFLSYEDTLNFASFRNIPALGILSFDQPNVFDLSGSHSWMFLKKDLDLFKDMVSKWI